MFENPNTSFDARVARGVAFLHSLNPGWWKRVSLVTLDTMSICDCPFAQATGTPYAIAVSSYGLSQQQEIDYGFYHSLNESLVGISEIWEHYGELDKAWRRAIRAMHAGTYVGALPAEEALAA